MSKLFSTDSTIVEPIVSILLRLVCPLTCYKTISAALSDGLAVLSILLPVRESRYNPLPNPADIRAVAMSTQMPNIASQFRNLSNSDIRALQTMAINGLQKTRENFLKGVGYVVRDAGSQWTDNLESVLLVYFIVKTFIRRFASYLPDDAIAEFNEFSKTELFEIQDQDTVVDHCDTELSLFAPPRLTIPINDNLEISKIGKCQKRYFFLPGVVDLSFWCSPIEDQGTIKSCAALAGISLLEYFAKRSHEGYTDVSALFLYKAARNLMHVSGDVGASLRETMKAMTVFGVPPEQYWPYDCDRVDVEPPPFCYAFAQSYQALKYFRLDYSGISEDSLLFQIKAILASGFPCMFGFTIYTSAYEDINVQRGIIPLPGYNDRVLGGHAVVAVGYSDYETIDSSGGETLSRGAFLIRNSWGKGWGREGYGWLPYDYVLHGLTADWWSLLKAEWFKDDSFGLGGRAPGGRYPLF
ncbi:MAG: C1 family peptidase [Elainellaceae cyanobacterium]